MDMHMFFTVLISSFLYMLPTIAAQGSGHRAHGGILVINLFLGWTGIGWIIALAWALSGNHDPQSQSARVLIVTILGIALVALVSGMSV